MSVHDNNTNGGRSVPFQIDESPDRIGTQVPPAPESNEREATDEVVAPRPGNFATRAGIDGTPGIGKNKLILLGGGLAVAVLFFVFTAIVGKSPKKQTTAKPNGSQASLSGPMQPKGSVTPLMETVHTPAPDNSSGQLGPGDIRRTRSSDGKVAIAASSQFSQKPTTAKPPAAASLGGVPSFADTQQKWEEPQPYGESASSPAIQTQQQNALKEASLIFVRNQTQSQSTTAPRLNSDDDDAPVLEMTPGMRIQAKLETQISSAVQEPVVAVVEYTYAIGDRVVVPAGARIYGKLVQADRSGLVNVEFDEIRLLDGNRDEKREKIDAIGLGLDLGPIKGAVSGKNTGKNFLVRAASGMGSVLAEIAGNNSSAAFSEDDMLRERLAENIGTAGDSEVMNLNANSRVVVTVPADTKIYVVFTKHQEKNSAELHKVSPATP
jgi:Bacterial conjugation TrbI-like protein